MKKTLLGAAGIALVTAASTAVAQMSYANLTTADVSAIHQCNEDDAGILFNDEIIWDDPSDLTSLAAPTLFSFSSSINPANYVQVLTSGLNLDVTGQASPGRFEVSWDFTHGATLATPGTSALNINHRFDLAVYGDILFEEDVTIRLSFDSEANLTYDNIFLYLTGSNGWPLTDIFYFDPDFSDISTPYSVELDVPAGSTMTIDLSTSGQSRQTNFGVSGTVIDLATSGSFVIEVLTQCAPDFNGVNGVTVQDIFDFLTAWLAGNSSADFNAVNGVTVQDIFDFLTAWLAGC